MEPSKLQFGEMVNAAQAYCALIDQATPANPAWFEHLFQSLPRLHAAVACLDSDDENALLPALIDIDARFELFSRLREALGERDGYWLQYDSDFAANAQYMSGSLADDLTDIYFDLKPGLVLLEDVLPENVAGFWQASFVMHWGQHLVDAERHLYALKVRQAFDA